MFKSEMLDLLLNGKSGKRPLLWSYYNVDDDSTEIITAPGYFANLNGLKNGDQIEVIAKDYITSKKGYVLINMTTGQITFTYQE